MIDLRTYDWQTDCLHDELDIRGIAISCQRLLFATEGEKCRYVLSCIAVIEDFTFHPDDAEALAAMKQEAERRLAVAE